MTDTEPAEDWTIRQSALMDAVREVALCAETPGAMFAAKHLVRLLCLELGHPEPVEREGGIAGALFGNPPKPAPKGLPRPLRDTPQA